MVAFGVLLYFVSRAYQDAAHHTWRIDSSEITFDDPPLILGVGSFGYVTRAVYRGSYVALKVRQAKFLPLAPPTD